MPSCGCRPLRGATWHPGRSLPFLRGTPRPGSDRTVRSCSNTRHRYSVGVVPDDPDGSALRDTVEELRQENERLRRAEEAGRRQGDRWKAVVSWVLIVVACLLSVVSVFVVFARNEVLNTDTYVSTVTPLASNPAVQSAVAKRVSERLIEQTRIEGKVKRGAAAPGRISRRPDCQVRADCGGRDHPQARPIAQI